MVTIKKINQTVGVIYDSIQYNTIYFCSDNTYSFLKPFAEKESDIFENYYIFRKRHPIDPPDCLYPFFYFDSRTPSMAFLYFNKYFDFINGSTRGFLELLTDKVKLKQFAYIYFLDTFNKDINIRSVINGDIKQTALAATLLASLHVNYPKQIHSFFYEFDEIADVLITHMKTMMHKINLFHAKRKNYREKVVDDFLESDHLNVISKSFFDNEKINFSNQIFSVSFFNRMIISTKRDPSSKLISLLIGDMCNSAPFFYANYKHVTSFSSAYLLSNEATRDILYALKKGEKSINQLSLILNYSRGNIDKFVSLLFNEMAIIKSRVSGKEAYYKINKQYFAVAQTELNSECDYIIN